MKKQIAVLALCAVLFALYSSAQAQQPTKIFRIGFLDSSTASGMAGVPYKISQNALPAEMDDGKKKVIDEKVAANKTPLQTPPPAADVSLLQLDVVKANSRHV